MLALTYHVCLITEDEMISAGSGKMGASNESYYLYRGSSFFNLLLSPCSHNGNSALVFGINGRGGLDAANVNGSGAVAPVINLSAEYVKTLRGTGTMTDPYQTA